MRKIFTFIALLCAGIMMAALPQGALNGLFTINADGEKIIFSQGNLQATTEDLGVNWTWSFATNQYDYIGNAAANTAINGNGTVSSNGTIDLFGWSTAATTFGIHNSKDNSIYSGDFVDWGVNAITNGGNKANAWRTLTKDEWVYLFYTRTDAATLFGLGSVNGVNGLILLPDNWDLPTGASFTPSTTQGLEDQGDFYKNSNSNNFSHNTYTTEQWAVMESAGAVFLPAAGFRTGTDVDNNYVGSYGYCWSASTNSLDYPYRLNFTSGFLRPQNTGTRDYGMSVRLVKKAPVVGDTIQYEYKGNNLYYKIYTKNETCKEVMIINDGTPETYWTEANKPTGALVIPDSVEDWQGTKYAVAYMYSNAFRNCTGITSVDFSENKGLTYITAHGFEDCTALAEVTLSDYITTLNSYCFKGCTSLTTIDFKNVVTLSGPTNFWDCNIALVHITKSLKTIPDQTDLFDHATTITCDEENPYFVAVDNVLYSKDTTQIYGLPIGLTTAEVHVPTTVTKVLYAAFYQFEGTLFINSEIKPTWPSTGGDWRNSPKGDVIVGCGLYDYYNAWRGNENNFQNITSLTEQLLWNVDVHAAAHGSVAIIDTTECNQVHITATPDEGYVFNSWSNGLKEAEITIDVDRDTTITAYFNKLITNVELSISQLPKLNETRGENSFAASVADDADYAIDNWIFIDDADLWTGDPTDIFTPGLYAVNVCIKPKSGFVFPVTDLNIADVSKITATVNGETPDQVHGGWEGVPVLYLSTDFTISDATGIEQITNDKSQTTKIIKDNQLFILRGDKVYTITGQEVK